MQPSKSSGELAEIYPDLEPWQRDELNFGTEEGLLN
tara:strand:+ start:182 stop:289 length:108 start_codon:yes stop_codon:yes gene_type:complete